MQKSEKKSQKESKKAKKLFNIMKDIDIIQVQNNCAFD